MMERPTVGGKMSLDQFVDEHLLPTGRRSFIVEEDHVAGLITPNAEPGPQIIRLLFDQPQKLKRIWLVFEETETRHTGVRLEMIAGSRAFLPKNCSSAMEF